MKSFFLILLLIIAAFLGTSTYAHISNTLGKEVPLKTGDSKDKESIMRTSIPHSTQAFIGNNQLLITFHKQFCDIEVSIVNVQTGETCYSQDYIDIDNVVIDLQEFGVGEYQLVLSLNTTMLYGNFIIQL